MIIFKGIDENRIRLALEDMIIKIKNQVIENAQTEFRNKIMNELSQFVVKTSTTKSANKDALDLDITVEFKS